jgi:hydroxylamine reductase (hybrid-cluster protein)
MQGAEIYFHRREFWLRVRGQRILRGRRRGSVRRWLATRQQSRAKQQRQKMCPFHADSLPEAAAMAGPGLREVCEAIGIPPILHLGACVDNSRILTIATAMALEGGLSDEIGGMPAVGIAPEWMSEKAIAIGCYFAASGVPVIFGGESPVEASREVTKIMTEVWFEDRKSVV